MKTLITIVASIATVSSFAQDVKFGKISKQDFEKKKSTIQADAPAEVLFADGNYKVSFNTTQGGVEQTKRVFYRYIIFDKDKTPDDVLKIEIPLYKSSGADQDKVLSFKAVTYNLENGKVVEQKVEKKDIFQEKVHRFLDKQTFTFPNVKNGSILEYSYEILSPFVTESDTWYFQQSIPVVESSLTMTTQEYFNYQHDLKGGFIPKVKKESKQEVFNKTSVERGYLGSSTINSDKLELKLNGITYSFNNLPAYTKEGYVLNSRNLLASIRFELASYIPVGGTPKYYTSTWDLIGQDLLKHDEFGRELIGNSFLDEKVKELTSNKKPEEKLVSIFEYIKNNFIWNDYVSLYTENGVKRTFNEKKGNSADINLLMISMLQKSGLDANPVVLSTVQNGLLNYSFPSRSKLNYVIGGVVINNNFYLLDGTEKYSQINLLPIRAINDRGFLLTSSGAKEITLRNSVETSDAKTINATLEPNGDIAGTYSSVRDNYFYMADLNDITRDPKGFEKEYTEDYNFEISDFKTQDNKKDLIRHQFKFSDVKVDVAGNKILFSPFLFLANTKHNLNLDKRNYNIEFGAPITTTNTVKIKIPTGYRVESLPAEKQLSMPDQAGGYGLKVIEKDGFIIAQAKKIMPYSVLPAQYYSHLKEFLTNIINAEGQQVILVKE